MAVPHNGLGCLDSIGKQLHALGADVAAFHAVSYTHLDVYKRQWQNGLLNVCFLKITFYTEIG